MGLETATILALTAAAASAAGSVYSGVQQKKAGDKQASAAKKQLEEAKRTAQEEEQARNKANQKEINPDSLLDDNSTGSLGSTTLTGSRGDPFNPSGLMGSGNKLLGD